MRERMSRVIFSPDFFLQILLHLPDFLLVFVTLRHLARLYLHQLFLQQGDFPVMVRRISSFLQPFQLLLLLLLMLGVSVVQDVVVVVEVVAVLRGVARLQEHRQQVFTLILGILHAQAGGGILDTDAR